MAEVAKPGAEQTPQMKVPGSPIGMGRESFDKAVMDAQGDPGAAGQATVLPGASPEDMGNPFAARVESGSARLSNQELLARSRGARAVSQDGGSGAAGSQTNVQGQGDANPLQAENDRLKSFVKRLEADALLGRTVKADPILYQKVTDSMNGQARGSQYPVQTPDGQVVAIPAQGQYAQGQQPAKTLKEVLGLPPDWIPIFEDMETPGTDTYRWNQAKIRIEARTMIDEDNRQRAQTDALNQERQTFLGTGRSEDDLSKLLLWISDPDNFTMSKLWSYMNLVETVQNATDRGNGGQRPEYNPSVSAQAGGGVIQEGEPPEIELGYKLLEMAEANRNPLFGGPMQR